ncbi:MAG: PDGLE domain-containing protein [Candidatus Limnocylindrales bacterium]
MSDLQRTEVATVPDDTSPEAAGAASPQATDAASLGTPASPGAPASRPSRLGRWWWVAGIALAALVVIVFAPLASPDPDGLERVATDNGFIDRAGNFVSGILGGYAIPGISDPAVSTVISGLLGVAIVLVAMVILGRVLARRRT